MKNRLVLFLVLLPFVLSCQKGQHNTESVPQIYQIQEQAKDIALPTPLWDLLTGSEFSAAVEQSKALVFVPIKVRLKERSPGVLSHSEIIFDFPRGGGEIDLAKVIGDQRGTFKLYFEFEGLKDPKELQIYFVSHSKKRKLEGEIYGSGCKFYLDIKDYILKNNSKDGLLINTTSNRHTTVLAGHFVFSYRQSLQTFLTRVTFADSSNQNLLCEEGIIR